MIQTIPAGEIKRRGIAAIEAMLERGPVHVFRNNRPICVVLSGAEYAQLAEKAAVNGTEAARPDVWSLILSSDGPAGRGLTPDEIKARIEAERGSSDRD